MHSLIAAGYMSHNASFLAQAKKDIEDKKQELQQARLERQHMEEYEVGRVT